MAKRPHDPEIQGLWEPHQNIGEFHDFSEYLEKWIKPVLLEDLTTVFEGARVLWKYQNKPLGSVGRGDFIMGTALFAVFDHLGAFITASDEEWITSSENVFRVAECLPSTSDIAAVVANMARNSLIHVAWPHTAIPMERHKWAFGITLGSNSNLKRHDNLFVTDWFPDARDGAKRQVLKLVLNVHAMRLQLTEWIHKGNVTDLVSPKAFKRVQDLSACAGDPDRDDEYRKLIRAGQKKDEKRKVPARCTWETMKPEIQNLNEEAHRLRVWGTTRERVTRDYGGTAEPDARAQERKRSIAKMLLPDITSFAVSRDAHKPPQC